MNCRLNAIHQIDVYDCTLIIMIIIIIISHMCRNVLRLD